MEELKALYDTYDKKMAKVREKASALAGLFGIGDDPRNHSCHDDFYEALEQWMQVFLNSQPDEVQAAQVVRFIIEAPHYNRAKETYWYLYAAQGLVKPLIPMLSQRECEQIRAWYADHYPVPDRMPVQQELYKLLCKHAGKQSKPASFLSKLFGK